MAKKKTHEEFIAELGLINPKIIVLGHYEKSNIKIECKCKKCGYEWAATPNSLLQGHGCDVCAHKENTKRRTKTTETFIKELSILNPDIEVIGKYTTARKPIECRCIKCGFKWLATASLLLRGRGCPNCYHSSTSFVEQCFRLSFERVIGKCDVKSRDKKAIGKELDIYLPSYHFAIEPGGWVWHKDKLQHDKEKRDLCKDKGITLLTIYDGFDGGVAPFTTNCLCYKEDLSDFAYSDLLLSVIHKVFCIAGITKHLSENEWNNIRFEAHLQSRRKTTEEFTEELFAINPNIQICGEYINNITPIQCKCKICGYTWSSSPSSLLRGSGCSKCSNKRLSEERTKPDKQFLQEVEKLLPNVRLLEPYKNLKTRIKCQCELCGNIWYAYPGNLLKGCGCRKCSYITIAKKTRKDHEDFSSQLQKINPQIELCSQYVGANKKIDVKCNVCGYEWSPRAADLLHGKGCPICSKKRRGLAARKSNISFVENLHKINDKIIPLEEYEKRNKRITVKCTVCGNIWKTTPKSLLQGAGCPKCGIAKRSLSRNKAVAQYSLEGKLITTYRNAKEASEATKSNITGIQATARGKLKTSNGFIWRYIESLSDTM